MRPTPTVFLVDPDSTSAKTTRRRLEELGYAVEAFSSAQDLLAATEADTRGCVFLELTPDSAKGLDAQQTISARRPALPIVFYTRYGEVATCAAAFRLGAIDFLEKSCGPAELTSALERAFTENAAELQSARLQTATALRFEQLTPRERDVFRLVAKGFTNREVGEILGISWETTKVHRARVRRKLQAESLAELVRIAQVVGEAWRRSGGGSAGT